MKKINWITITVIILSFLIGIISYSYLPNQIASHWGANGEVNGYMNKFWGVFLLPLISIALFLLFSFLPKIDPFKKNYEKFRGYYDSFILIIILFMFFILLLTIFWNLGIVFNMNTAIIPALGFLFIYIGIVFKNTKRNWFFGIRTAWTLSSDRVWKKTHELGSKLFIISGLITFIGLFFPKCMLWFVLVPVILSSIVCVIYSYVIYGKKNN